MSTRQKNPCNIPYAETRRLILKNGFFSQNESLIKKLSRPTAQMTTLRDWRKITLRRDDTFRRI